MCTIHKHLDTLLTSHHTKHYSVFWHCLFSAFEYAWFVFLSWICMCVYYMLGDCLVCLFVWVGVVYMRGCVRKKVFLLCAICMHLLCVNKIHGLCVCVWYMCVGWGGCMSFACGFVLYVLCVMLVLLRYILLSSQFYSFYQKLVNVEKNILQHWGENW